MVSSITKRKRQRKVPQVEFLNSGSVNLNLAISGKGRNGGWARGRINNLVGDGSSGKTLLALEVCADAFYNVQQYKSQIFPEVKKVHIVYNNVEGVMDFPIEEMYGEEFAKAIYEDYESKKLYKTATCQEFGRDYLRRVSDLKNGEFLLYVIDSLDALDSLESRERIQQSLKNGKEIEGSYGTERAKYFSQSFFRELCNVMTNKDATLLIVNQIREKMNAGPFEEKHYRTGGKALDFYTHVVAWLYTAGKLDVQIKGKKVITGVKTKLKVTRNKCAKPFREAYIRILFDYGLDNIGSMLDYLGKCKKSDIQREAAEIEQNDQLYDDLVNSVIEEWDYIENETTTKRQKRFVRN